MANGDVYEKIAGVWTKIGNIAGPSGPVGAAGSPSTNDFRLTLSTGNPVYRPQPATPSSTDTVNDIVTFAADPGWTDGTIVTPASTLAGLTTGTRYFIHRITSTTYSFHTSVANAIAGTPKVDLTANVTQQINPSGVSHTTVRLSPYIGATTFTYVSSVWTAITSAEISLALGTLTSDKNYDVFAYSNAGVLTLELSAAWSSDLVRTDAVVQQDGVWVKSADKTRRYVGTIRMDSTTTTIDDAGGIASQIGGRRYVWNMQNRVASQMRVRDFTATWSYSTNTWRQANGNAGNKIEYVIGLALDSQQATVNILIATPSSTAEGAIGVGVDSITAEPYLTAVGFGATGGSGFTNGVTLPYDVAPGYHYASWMENSPSAVACNFIGNSAVNGRAGLTGIVWQ